VERSHRLLQLLDYDVVVVTGMSGAILAAPLKVIYDTPILILRKNADHTHGKPIEGHVPTKKGYEWAPPDTALFRWVFLDDLVETGATLGRVVRSMQKRFSWATLAGVVTHTESTYAIKRELDYLGFTSRAYETETETETGSAVRVT
jgi:hypoxanthine phosphoribosyltransferase